METSEYGLKFLGAVLLAAVSIAILIRRRYGRVGEKLIARMGLRWTLIVRIGSIATLVFWLVFWVTVSPERSAELRQYFDDNIPWTVRDGPSS